MVDWAEVWHEDHDVLKGGQAPRHGLSYGEIGEAMGLAKASVRHIEQVALRKIRANPALLQQLEGWR